MTAASCHGKPPGDPAHAWDNNICNLCGARFRPRYHRCATEGPNSKLHFWTESGDAMLCWYCGATCTMAKEETI